MTHGAGFRVSGMVHKRFVAPSGKIAFLTLEVHDGSRKKKIEMRAFDDQVIVEVGSLREGQDVEVTGSVDSEQPKNRDRTAVQKDGRDYWTVALTIRAVKGAAPPPPKPSLDDSDVMGF